MSMLPFTVEPMISQSAAERSVISEAYLRMTCATIYHNSGNDERAVFHIDRAISLVLPDKLYGFLAEYCRVLGRLLEQRLCLIDPAAWEAVRKLHRQYNAGWSKLSGSIRGKEIATTLSPKEREVAKLAAFGMQNSEIAHKLNMSLSGVKQAVRIVSEKTGVSRDQFATIM
jgi:DNA-binding NarL/FixJ family response regulator